MVSANSCPNNAGGVIKSSPTRLFVGCIQKEKDLSSQRLYFLHTTHVLLFFNSNFHFILHSAHLLAY